MSPPLLGGEAPARGRIAVGFGQRSQGGPGCKLDVELADGAERPDFSPSRGRAGPWGSRVVVGQAEHATRSRDALDQVENIGKGRGERLVADHVEASGQRVTRPRVVPDKSLSCAGMHGVSEDQASCGLQLGETPPCAY